MIIFTDRPGCTHIVRAKHRKMRWGLVPVTVFPVTSVRLKPNATRSPVAYFVKMVTFAGTNILLRCLAMRTNERWPLDHATETRTQREAAFHEKAAFLFIHAWREKAICCFFVRFSHCSICSDPDSEAFVTLCLQDPSRDMTVRLRNAVNLGRQFVPYARFPTG